VKQAGPPERVGPEEVQERLRHIALHYPPDLSRGIAWASRSGFASGIASAFNLTGGGYRFHLYEPSEDDIEALSYDWTLLLGDLNQAIWAVRTSKPGTQEPETGEVEATR